MIDSLDLPTSFASSAKMFAANSTDCEPNSETASPQLGHMEHNAFCQSTPMDSIYNISQHFDKRFSIIFK